RESKGGSKGAIAAGTDLDEARCVPVVNGLPFVFYLSSFGAWNNFVGGGNKSQAQTVMVCCSNIGTFLSDNSVFREIACVWNSRAKGVFFYPCFDATGWGSQVAWKRLSL
ncbi:unnamed protein product, partial [Pylaiella littoralis]